MDPGDARHGSNENAVRVKHRLGEVGGGGRIADGHVLPVGGAGEAAIGLGRPGVPGIGVTGGKLGDKLPGANADGCVVAVGCIAELGEAGGVGWGKDEAGQRGWWYGWRRRPGGGRWLCPVWWQWMLKVTGALEAVEERIIGIGSGAVGTQEVSQCADGGCGRE